MCSIHSANYLELVMMWRLSLSSPQSKFMQLTLKKIVLALYNCVCLRNLGEVSTQLHYETKVLRYSY